MEEAASEAAEHNLQIATVWSSSNIWVHGDTVLTPSSRLFRDEMHNLDLLLQRLLTTLKNVTTNLSNYIQLSVVAVTSSVCAVLFLSIRDI